MILERKNYWRITLAGIIVFLLRTTGAGQELAYRSQGTGRTTGHIITLSIYNRSADSVEVRIGPCLIPATGKYQGYVINHPHRVVVPPNGRTEIALRGYCTNVFKPAVPLGAALPAFTEWTHLEESLPAPVPAQPVSPEFTSWTAPPTDSFWLAYAGTDIPFPYRIDFDHHPASSAALLIETVNMIEKEARENKPVLPLPRSTTELSEQSIVQQVFWQYTARLSGRFYAFPYFQDRLKEQIALINGRPAERYSREALMEIYTVSLHLWSAFEQIARQAKLVVPAGQRAAHIPAPPQYNPSSVTAPPPPSPLTGPPRHPSPPRSISPILLSQVKDKIRQLNPEDENMIRPWLDLILLTTIGDDTETAAREINDGLAHKLTEYQRRQTERLLPSDPHFSAKWATLERALSDEWTQHNLEPEVREICRKLLRDKFSSGIRWKIDQLKSAGTHFVRQWRIIDQLAKTHWFDEYLAEKDREEIIGQLRQQYRQWEKSLGRATDSRQVEWDTLTLTHYTFKIPVAVPSPFPVWIPIAGGAALTGAVIWAGGGKKTSPPPAPPVARDDVLTIPCNGQASINVLANDAGNELSIVLITSPPGISISESGGTLQISSVGLNNFSFTYTVADPYGQSATATVSVTVSDNALPVVTCPASVIIDCAADTAPTSTGQAMAVDNCDPYPAVSFTDAPSGTNCERVLARTWTATDQRGQTARCTQTITLRDEKAPELSCPPSVVINPDGDLSPTNTGRATVQDNCSLSTQIALSFSDSTAGLTGCSGTGTILRTWTATDACGNTRSCAQEIRLEDSEPPLIVCPFPIPAMGLNDIAPSRTGQATAEDNASTIENITITYEDDFSDLGDCGGILARRWSAADVCGNVSSCTQDIVITDAMPPVMTCPGPVMVRCDELSDTTVTGRPVVADNYSDYAGIALAFSDDASGLGEECAGTVVRTWTATDRCGNVSSCMQEILVVPNQISPAGPQRIAFTLLLLSGNKYPLSRNFLQLHQDQYRRQLNAYLRMYLPEHPALNIISRLDYYFGASTGISLGHYLAPHRLIQLDVEQYGGIALGGWTAGSGADMALIHWRAPIRGTLAMLHIRHSLGRGPLQPAIGLGGQINHLSVDRGVMKIDRELLALPQGPWTITGEGWVSGGLSLQLDRHVILRLDGQWYLFGRTGQRFGLRQEISINIP